MNWRVYWNGEYPKPKKQFHDGEFEKRQQARQWCRNHPHHPGMTLVHPDGTEEPYATLKDK